MAVANKAAAQWPSPPAAVVRSLGVPLSRRPVPPGGVGSDGVAAPPRPGNGTPSNVLWVRVTNVTVAVTLGALYELFGVHGKVTTAISAKRRKKRRRKLQRTV